jgi:hypothetical protein
MLRRLYNEVRCSTFLRAIRCESRLLHTLQSVQSYLSYSVLSLALVQMRSSEARFQRKPDNIF